MEMKMKTNISVAKAIGYVAAAIGVIVIGSMLSNPKGQGEVSYSFSCSNPAVAETIQAIIFRVAPPMEYPVSNAGPVGAYGNVLVCSANYGSMLVEYSIQLLDNGKFRVNIENGVINSHLPLSMRSMVGPVSFEEVKKSTIKGLEETAKAHEERRKEFLEKWSKSRPGDEEAWQQQKKK
jgi:hypothetical protein